MYLALHTPWQLGYLTPSKNRGKNPHFNLISFGLLCQTVKPAEKWDPTKPLASVGSCSRKFLLSLHLQTATFPTVTHYFYPLHFNLCRRGKIALGSTWGEEINNSEAEPAKIKGLPLTSAMLPVSSMMYCSHMRPEWNSRIWHLWGKNARDCGSLTGKRGVVSKKLKEPLPTLSKTVLYTFKKTSIACLCP